MILRDIEELSYEQISEIMGISLGTVKSRLVRGRDALKKRLESYVRDVGPALGLCPSNENEGAKRKLRHAAEAESSDHLKKSAIAHEQLEVTHEMHRG